MIETLGLSECQNTKIGNQIKKGISGGERKRTSIAIELIKDPQLILLDEPTSGLDSFKATAIVKYLSKLARQGKTVVATIHQPSSEAFHYFDRLILMVDGFIAYQGKAKRSTDYFSLIGYPMPQYGNPTDHYMRVLSVTYPKTEADIEKLQILDDKYTKHIANKVEDQIQKIKLPALDASKRTNMAPFFTQIKALAYRHRVYLIEEPLALRAKMGSMVIVGILIGAVFADMGYGVAETESISNTMGYLFLTSMLIFMIGLMGNIANLVEMRPVFMREIANQQYTPTAFFISQHTEIPIQIMQPLIFLIVTYFWVGLNIWHDPSHFFGMYLALFLEL